jgi:hypothetical protein
LENIHEESQKGGVDMSNKLRQLTTDDLLLQLDVNSVVLVVSRDEVEKLDHSGCLGVLDSLIESREKALRFRDQVVFGVDGYNDDPRELFEIPKVRTFVRELDAKWPYWFFFLSKATDALSMIMLSLCRYQRVGAGLTRYDPGDFELFMYGHFDGLNRIFDRFDFDKPLNKEMSEAIFDYFSSDGKP